jgi:hypothetical protein
LANRELQYRGQVTIGLAATGPEQITVFGLQHQQLHILLYMLFPQTFLSDVPPNRSGSPNNISYASPNPNTIFTLSTPYTNSNFSCSEPTHISEPFTPSIDYETPEGLYISQVARYRFLYFNEDYRINDEQAEWFEAQSGSSMDIFMQAEQSLYAGDHEAAVSLISEVTATNTVEEHYATFYTLYARYEKSESDNNFLLENIPFSYADSVDLLEIASLCPILHSACVYQARALYNAIYRRGLNYSNCEPLISPRPNSNTIAIPFNEANVNNEWIVKIFPIPARDMITIQSSKINDVLEITIMDVMGGIVLSKNLILNSFLLNLDISLPPGSFVVKIKNQNNQSIIKKLIITE